MSAPWCGLVFNHNSIRLIVVYSSSPSALMAGGGFAYSKAITLEYTRHSAGACHPVIPREPATEESLLTSQRFLTVLRAVAGSA
jgi:hypothetical protein